MPARTSMESQVFDLQNTSSAILRQMSAPGNAAVPQPGPPSAYSDNPGENLTAFLYKAQLSNANFRVPGASDHQLIVCVSSFLNGMALEWFLDLLRRNAVEAIPAENRRLADQRQRAADERANRIRDYPPVDSSGSIRDDLKLRDYLPGMWAEAPFMLPELLSFEAFAQALAAAFPNRRPEASTRAQTPTGPEATISWD